MKGACAVVLLAAVLVAPPAAFGHERGKAEPRLGVGVRGTGLDRVLDVRLRDADSGEPIAGATVTAQAQMTAPHLMRLAPWRLRELSGGRYRAAVHFLMPARWRVELRVQGPAVVPASSALDVDTRGAAAPGITPVETRLEDDLTGRDYLAMASLWVHGLAAGAWLVGVLALLVALSARADVLTEGFRTRLARWYRGRGAWGHWALVPVIVATGSYQMVEVTPFRLAWRPGDLDRLRDIPYGVLYEAILVVKLGLFALLLVTATLVLLRLTRSPGEPVAGGGFVRTLGAAGILYVASVPLILGAAMALRYVHVLSHVAEVIQAG